VPVRIEIVDNACTISNGNTGPVLLAVVSTELGLPLKLSPVSCRATKKFRSSTLHSLERVAYVFPTDVAARHSLFNASIKV